MSTLTQREGTFLRCVTRRKHD